MLIVSASILACKSPQSRFIDAANAGSDQDVAALLSRGVDVNTPYSRNGSTALMYAVVGGHRNVVKLLLERGADLEVRDAKGLTALLYGERQDSDVDVLKMLIDHKADVNARAPDGATPLINAALAGRADLARLLLAGGADPSLSLPAGDTALSLARANQHPEVVEILQGAPSAAAPRPAVETPAHAESAEVPWWKR